MWPFTPLKPAYVATDRFKLVEVQHPTDGGWEAHRWYAHPNDPNEGEWRRLKMLDGDIGVVYETYRTYRANAERHIADVRAQESTPVVVQEIEV